VAILNCMVLSVLGKHLQKTSVQTKLPDVMAVQMFSYRNWRKYLRLAMFGCRAWLIMVGKDAMQLGTFLGFSL
jgi:hypothetical protein